MAYIALWVGIMYSSTTNSALLCGFRHNCSIDGLATPWLTIPCSCQLDIVSRVVVLVFTLVSRSRRDEELGDFVKMMGGSGYQLWCTLHDSTR